MNIFFTASREGYEKFGTNYKKIVEILKEQGNKVNEDVIENAENAKKYDNFEERYKKVNNWIKQADVIVAEISTPSTGVGHEIYQALSAKKQVVVLMNGIINKDHAATLRGNPSKNIHIYEYTDSNIEKILSDAMKESKRLLDTKFILIISPEIDRYLEWASKRRRMHKAQVVRKALEGYMTLDESWCKENGIEYTPRVLKPDGDMEEKKSEKSKPSKFDTPEEEIVDISKIAPIPLGSD